MKFCTVIRGPKSKIEFVWDKNLITLFPILPQIFKNLHYGLWELQSGISRSPVKDNCALCLPGQSYDVISIYPFSTPVAIATIQKLQNFALQPMEISQRYNAIPVKDNCALLSPTPHFRARAI